MIRKCAWCNKSMGRKKPLADKSITHSICRACYEKERLSNWNPAIGMTHFTNGATAQVLADVVYNGVVRY